MQFFKKIFAKETNEIDNKKIKEFLGNSAIDMLAEGRDYQSLTGTTCVFGYIFLIKRTSQIEALFKVVTDVDVFYFAAQKGSLMRLNINEETYNNNVSIVLKLHS